MGDSDEEYNNSPANLANSSNQNNNSSSISNNNVGTNSNSNSFNSNSKKNNRDKFYRERDDSNNSNNNSYNRNNNDTRRDWNNDRRGNDSWKSRGGGMSGGAPSSHMSGGGYGGGGNPGYNRMGGGSSDYPRKYAQQNSPGNYDSSPPPYKRKKDWDGDAGRGGLHSTPGAGDSMYSSGAAGYHTGGGYGAAKHHSAGQQHSDYNKSQAEPEYPTQPPFLSFKLFLQQQDDSISDEEAIRKYNEYKMDFKKTQINNFFLEHKEEEWFKSRYHPDENYKRRNEQNQYVLKRLDVFMELMNDGWLENVSADYDKSKELIKFLDAVVIKLEDGTEQDLKQLETNGTSAAAGSEDDVKEIKPEKERKPSKDGEPDAEIKAEIKEENGSDLNGDSKNNGDSGAKKRKAEDSGSESGAYTDSDSDNDGGSKSEHKKKSKSSKKDSSSSKHPRQLHKTASIFMRNLAPSVSKQDLEALCKNYDGFKRVALSDPAPERGFFRRGWITFEPHVDVKKLCWNLQNIKVKDFNPGAIVNRELTNRIRPVPSLVTHHKSVVKNDIKQAMKIVQNMDKKWNLWQEKSLDESIEAEEEAAPIASTGDAKQDNENNEVANLEKQAFSKLPSNGPKFQPHKYTGQNPLLNNITDYLVDEMSAEEEELLGDASSKPAGTSGSASSAAFDIELDKNYTKILDRLLIYLRVVHSFDYYNTSEYQQEDSMPNRCGIMFVRPAVPVNAATASLKCTQDEINQYTQQFEVKIKVYVDYKDRLDAETAKKLGTKDRREEVEKFIKTNTQELGPDRWLCPLSGKKFKGPEFIRKHLFYKHMEKITEVKKEVEYFNNYVFDPKRPQLPEHPSNKTSTSGGSTGSPLAGSSSGGHHQQSLYSNQMSNQNLMQNTAGLLASPMMGQMGFGGMQGRPMNAGGWQSAGFMPDMMQQHQSGYGGGANFSAGYGGGMGYQGYKKPGYSGGYSGRRGGGGGGRDREMIQYKDLDAPEDS